MARLNTSIHSKFSEDVVSRLKLKKICTVTEFVLEDSEKLMRFSGLSYKNVLELKQIISESFGGVIKRPSELLEMEKRNIVPTNIQSLDNLLKGGLYPGQIYEICGLSSSGKTQLCLTITANIVQQSNAVVRYIDTKKDFSASRISMIMEGKSCNNEVINEAMDRIRIYCIQSIHQLLQVLHHLTTALKSEQNELRTRVVIIDSLPAVIFKYSKDHEINYALNRLANFCRYIANEFHLSVIITNLITIWNTRQEASTSKNISNTVISPTLGKYWLHIPNTRLLVEKQGSKKRKITVWKSFQLEMDTTCVVGISDAGIT